jgi:hypothetical protein
MFRIRGVRISRHRRIGRVQSRLAGRGRRIPGKSIDRQMGTINLSPLRVAGLLTLRKRRHELVATLGDPARRLVIVFCCTSILIGRRWLGRSVSLSFRRLSRPFERQIDIVVWVIVRSTVPMRVGCWPGSRILRHRRGYNLAGGHRAEHLWDGRWCMVHRG